MLLFLIGDKGSFFDDLENCILIYEYFYRENINQGRGHKLVVLILVFRYITRTVTSRINENCTASCSFLTGLYIIQVQNFLFFWGMLPVCGASSCFIEHFL